MGAAWAASSAVASIRAANEAQLSEITYWSKNPLARACKAVAI